MIDGVLLVIVLLAAGAAHQGLVVPHKDVASCEKAAREFIADAQKELPPSTMLVVQCTKPIPLNGVRL